MIVRGWRWGALALAMATATVAFWPRPADLARARVEAGDHAFAVPYLEGVLLQKPTDPWVQAALLKAYMQAGQRRKALNRLIVYGRLRALSVQERRWAAHWALAEGKAGLAIDVLTGPNEPKANPDLLDTLTDYAMMAGRLAQAKAFSAERARALPLDAEAQARASDVALAAADPAAAVAWQSRVVALSPDAFKPRARLAELLLASGKPLAAVAALEGHLPENPKEASPWHRKLARWALWGKAPLIAAKHLEALWAEKPSSELALELLQAYVAAKSRKAADFGEAQAKRFMKDAELGQMARQVLVDQHQEDRAMLLAQAQLQVRPNDAKTHEDLVGLALGKQRYAIAGAELERWMALHPLDLEASHRRAQLDAWNHQPAAAFKRFADLLRPAHRLDLGRELAWREEMLGVTTLQDDTRPEALANLSRLVALRPNRADWRRRLATTLLELGEHDGAIAQRRALLGLPGATRSDALELATWLGWHDRLGDALSLLKRLHQESPLDAGTLRETGLLAARNSRWKEATFFLEQAAGRTPGDATNWEQLARVHEAEGDLKAASQAWAKRLALQPEPAAYRLRASSLMSREGRLREALAFLKSWGDRLELAELRERVALAIDLKDRNETEAAWRAFLAKSPRDPRAWLALAGLLETRGARLEAAVAYRQALAHGPNDGEVLGSAALGLLGAEGPQALRPLMPQLEAIREPNEAAARALVEVLATEHPDRAWAVLANLHERGLGGADTWLRQAELANALGRWDARGAYEKALALASPDAATDANAAELTAYALDRLGRQGEATQAWQDLAKREPGRLGPNVALARQALKEGKLEEALAWARAARKAAPQALEGRLTEAEALLAARQLPEAEAILAPLHEERPDLAFVTSQLAAVRYEQGRAAAATALLREGLAREPHDRGLMAQYLGARDRGRSGLDAYARIEQQQVLNRFDAGLRGELRLGPDGKPDGGADSPWRMAVEAGTIQVSGSSQAQAERVAVGLGADSPQGEGLVQVELARLNGQVRAPLLTAQAAKDLGAFRVEGRAAEARWTDSNDAIGQDGRERRVGGTLRYRPDPRFNVGLSGDAGRLLLNGQDAGMLHDASADVALRRDPGDPFYLVGQVRVRGWGQAASLVGLPSQVRYAALLFGWAERFGPVRVEIQPGWVAGLDGVGNSPSASGFLAIDPYPDLSMELNGTYSPGAIAVGLGGSYTQAGGQLRWRF